MFPDEGLAQPARFRIVTWDGGGNFPPAQAIGRRLVESGHAARILGPRSLQARVMDGGVGFSACSNAPEWRSLWQTALDWQYLEELWLGPGVAVDLQSELAREPADVLLVDYVLFGGIAAAELSGLPTAGLMLADNERSASTSRSAI